MVASGLLNFFQPPAKTAEKATTSAFSDAKETPESAEAGRTFARMVQASADSAGQHDREPARTTAKAAGDLQTAALNARLVGEMGLTPAQLARTVTPEQAAELLSDFEANRGLFGNLSQDPQTQQQLKEQLLTIVETHEPKTVEEIIAAVEPANSAADMAQGDMADAADGISVQAALAHTAQRVLTLFNKALSTPAAEKPHAADSDAEVAAAAVNPALLALHAGSFPLAAAQEAAQTPAAASALAADATQTVTVITPLSQQTAIHSYAATAAAEIEDIAQVPVAAPQAIDSRIPSLALVKDKDALPDISLPKAQLPEVAEAAPAVAKPAIDIARQLETLGTTAKLLATDERPVEAKPVAAANAAAAIAPMQAGIGTVSPHAIAPAAGVLGQGVINHAPVSSQVSVAIRQASKEGIDQITVQLDPLNLGRIEVKLQMHRDGHTQIAFMVDKAETFDALSRDARALEQSLQEAGIKADTSGMQFNLRQSPQQQLSDNQHGGDGHHGTAADVAPAAQAAALAPEPTKTYRLDIRDGVDIQA